jgi:hypothetical protein
MHSGVFGTLFMIVMSPLHKLELEVEPAVLVDAMPESEPETLNDPTPEAAPEALNVGYTGSGSEVGTGAGSHNPTMKDSSK